MKNRLSPKFLGTKIYLKNSLCKTYPLKNEKALEL